MPKAVIRAATLEELETCAAFWHAMFSEIAGSDRIFPAGWEEAFVQYFRRRVNEDDARYFVALDNTKIIGTAGAILRDGYPFTIMPSWRTGYILGVRVEPAHRGHGTAAALTEACVAWLRRIGCTRIRLHASSMGRPIYERLGFVRTNEMELR